MPGFGPLVAGARLVAALAVARLRRESHEHGEAAPLTQLQTIVPIALAAAVAALMVPAILPPAMPGPFAFAAGMFTAFVMAPCALGAVGFAAALRGVLPAAAAGFLCVAGIFDARSWMRGHCAARAHDALSYALLALACAIVAAHGGAGLVHPRIAFALWPCAIASAHAAYRFRGAQNAALRVGPVLMLAGACLGAPLPQYHATETTIADAFAGERVDFTGVLTRTGNAQTLVRYAITCCRADAAPIVLRLERAQVRAHGWLHARGVLVAHGTELQMRASSLVPVDPPADPFVYR
jgi:hypothetical protein